MTPNDQGRHCDSCCKTVVDFTSWELTDIAAYLKSNAQSHVCGRFKTTQLNKPFAYSPEEWVTKVAGTGLSVFQKLALVFLMAFGFLGTGCGEEKAAAPLAQSAWMAGANATNNAVPTCTTPEPMQLGEPAAIDTPVKGKIVTPIVDEPEPQIMGGMIAMPEEPALGGAPVMQQEPTDVPPQDLPAEPKPDLQGRVAMPPEKK